MFILFKAVTQGGLQTLWMYFGHLFWLSFRLGFLSDGCHAHFPNTVKHFLMLAKLLRYIAEQLFRPRFLYVTTGHFGQNPALTRDKDRHGKTPTDT